MIDFDLHSLIIIAALILGAVEGYKKGFARGISHLISIICTIFTMKLILIIVRSVGTGNVKSGIINIALLVVFGAIYGIIRKIVASMKAIANLPIISFVDRLLGIIIGVAWAVFFIFFAFGFISGFMSY